MDEKDKKEITSWIGESFQDGNLKDLKIELMGTNAKGEGYGGEFIFAKVIGTNKDNQFEEVHVAIKMGKKDNVPGENLPMLRECYKRELFFYDKVLPAFRKFQLDRKIMNTFDAVPKCYKTISTAEREVIVMENLKKKGYTLHDKRKPMNSKHLRLVLKNYAKFHALSFAMKDQDKEEYHKLTGNYCPVVRKIIKEIGMFRAEDDKVQQCLRKGGREDLVNKYEEKLEKGEENIMIDIIDAGMEIEESVILHFDCHNNNFLFDYKEDDRENPLNVSIFDWQMSGLQSPVLDLSYFLYCTASREDLSRLDELLKFYHGHLTSFLKDLGSNVEKLFPYSTLVEHWKKYNTYAFIMAKSFVGLCLASEEDSPDFGDLKGIADVLAEFAKKYENLYTERLITLVDHYCSFILN